MRYFNIDQREFITFLIFNNDESRNSLSIEMLREFSKILNDINESDAKVLIIKGNKNSKVWCAGFNIQELSKPGIDPVPNNHPIEVLLRNLQKVKIPVIAMMEGSVWGGGCDIAFACDILIGTHQTTFAITPAKIGVTYNTQGIMRVLNNVQPNIAKELFFSAKPIAAMRAYQLGILNHLVEVDELEQFTIELAQQIASNSTLAISVIKRQINMFLANKKLNTNNIKEINQLRETAYNSKDYMEGMAAFKEKRKPKCNNE